MRPTGTWPIGKFQLTEDRWMSEVQGLLNSIEEFRMDELFFVEVDYTDLTRGRCVRNVPRR